MKALRCFIMTAAISIIANAPPGIEPIDLVGRAVDWGFGCAMLYGALYAWPKK